MTADIPPGDPEVVFQHVQEIYCLLQTKKMPFIQSIVNKLFKCGKATIAVRFRYKVVRIQAYYLYLI